MKQPQRLGDDFEFAFSSVAARSASLEVLRRAKPRAFRPRKCSESGSSVMMTKGCRAFLIAGSGKPRRGHEKRCGSPKQRRATKNTRAQEETSPGPPAGDRWATEAAAGPRRARGPRAGRKNASVARAISAQALIQGAKQI